MYEFKLADLGEGMHEAEVVEWLIKEGESTRLDQTIAKVETDKAMVELPSPIAGRVSEIRVKDGQVARVGDVLVVFETSTPAAETTAKNTETDATSQPVSAPAAAPSSVPSSQVATTATRPRVLAAPAVRKLAFELGVDLEQVSPSNPNGRVSLEDVRAYAERARTAPSPLPTPSSPAPTQEEQPAPVTEQKAEQAAPARQDEPQLARGLRKRIAEHREKYSRTIINATGFYGSDDRALLDL